MKNIEIKQIVAGSVFKFYFAIGTAIGLIVSIILLFTGASLKNIGIEIGALTLGGRGPFQAGAMMIGVVMGSLAYGVLTGLLGAVGALLYNVFAGMTGGIVVKVGEE